MIWIEKYRPQTFDETIGTPSGLKELVGQQMPHLLFAGPAGTGKTTIAKIIVKQLDANCLILNASDERGIDVIRNKVKTFASSLSTNQKIKIVFLDEGDMLTPEAQTALRNMMESYAHSTRFIITCNYLNKIIDPIRSRCAIFRFGVMEKPAVLNYLKTILDKENIKYDEGDVKKIVDKFYPDVRSCVNTIQRFSTDGVLRVADLNKYNRLAEDVASAVLQKDFTTARKLIIQNSPDYSSLFTKLFDLLVDKVDAQMLSIITAKYLYWNSLSADPQINFSAYLAELVRKM